MNPHELPADWGEPPATPEELSTSALLEEVMAKLERGETTLPQVPSVAPTELARDLGLLRSRAEAFRRYAGLLDDSRTLSDRTLTPEPATAPALPDPFPGKYRFEMVLGRGAFGEVWLAEDLNLGCHRALKTIRLSGTAGACAERLAALRLEARVLARLRHPNIVEVHAWEQAGDDHYLVLQYVSGGSLGDRVKKDGPLSWDVASRYVADVGDGLLAVHRAGLVHRDIKPANILWQPETDEALLTDFGIVARLADPGVVAGTPAYMSPEAIRGQATPAMDVYSLAATLFTLVTGEPPFASRSQGDIATFLADLLQRIERGLPDPDPRCRDLPRPLEDLIRAGLSPDVRRRPPLQEFVAALRGSLNQLVADSLTLPPATGPGLPAVEMRLVVSRRVGPDAYQRVAATHPQPDRVQRNMKKVPRPPEQVRLRTGDEVRVEVTASRTGYVTVFNVGPTGDLNLLFPDEVAPAGVPATIQANQSLHVLDVVMEPPIGRERLFAVWTSRPLLLELEHLRAIVEKGEVLASEQYRATRNMVKVKKAVAELKPEERQVVVLEVDHGS